MMRGLIVVITALMSVIFLGRKQYRHHLVGVFLIVFGVAIVGAVSIVAESDEPDSSGGGSAALGIILILFSNLFFGIQFTVEERILADYYLEPLLIIGTEGMWGIAYYIILLPIM